MDERLKSLTERIERLEEEKKALSEDLKAVYAEAKSAGYDTKALREVIKLRRMDSDKRTGLQTMVEIYQEALGMLADTPLGQAAMRAA